RALRRGGGAGDRPKERAAAAEGPQGGEVMHSPKGPALGLPHSPPQRNSNEYGCYRRARGSGARRPPSPPGQGNPAEQTETKQKTACRLRRRLGLPGFDCQTVDGSGNINGPRQGRGENGRLGGLQVDVEGCLLEGSQV